MNSCLLITDMQNDLVDDDIIKDVPKINNIKDKFKHIIFVVREYPKTHCSFKQSGGVKDANCIQHSYGAELCSGLLLDTDNDILIKRNMLTLYDSDSCFWISQETKKESELMKTLKQHYIQKIYIIGVNIFSTVLDCVKFRLDTYIIKDLCYGKHLDDSKLDFLEKNGVKIIEYYNL